MRVDKAGQSGPSQGVRFGKYHLVRKLGSGSFGSVYEAILPGPMGFAKRVAIKKLRSEVVDRPKVAEALVNEARIGGLLHHGNIVDILEFDRVDEHYYMAMEFVEGPTLTEVIHACRMKQILLPRFAVIAIGVDVCRGLHHAHNLRDMDGRAQNLVHRDIKPSNIILDAEGRAKILDFGIAKATTNLFHTTTSALIKGTPRYMSPEQVESAELTAGSDIFSVGVVLYEMITGHLLFTANGLPGLLHQILHLDLTGPTAKAEELMPGIGAILGRALTRDRAARYEGAGQMGDDLARLGRDYPPDASMGEVVARLMNEVASSRNFVLVRPDDLDDDSTREWQEQADPYPEGPPPDGVPEPDAADWDQFTTVFHDARWPEAPPIPAVPNIEPSEDPSAGTGTRRRGAWIALIVAVAVAVLAGGYAWVRSVPGPPVDGEDGVGPGEVETAPLAGPVLPVEDEGDPAAGLLHGTARPDARAAQTGDAVTPAPADPGNGESRSVARAEEPATPDPPAPGGETVAAPPAAGPLSVGVTCLQACYVYLDGKQHGSRAHMRTQLQATGPGPHRITLVRIDGAGTRTEKEFVVEAGTSSEFICWDFAADGDCG